MATVLSGSPVPCPARGVPAAGPPAVRQIALTCAIWPTSWVLGNNLTPRELRHSVARDAASSRICSTPHPLVTSQAGSVRLIRSCAAMAAQPVGDRDEGRSSRGGGSPRGSRLAALAGGSRRSTWRERWDERNAQDDDARHPFRSRRGSCAVVVRAGGGAVRAGGGYGGDGDAGADDPGGNERGSERRRVVRLGGGAGHAGGERVRRDGSRGADVVHGERDVSGAQHGAGDEAGFVCDPVFAERHDVGEHRRGDDGPGGELDDDDAGGGDDELVGGRDQPAGAGYLDCEWRPRHAQRRMGCCPGGRDVHGGDGAWRARDADVHAGVRDDADGELDGRERCDELQGRAGARRVRSAGDVGGDRVRGDGDELPGHVAEPEHEVLVPGAGDERDGRRDLLGQRDGDDGGARDGAGDAGDADVLAGVRDDADGELDGRERGDELQGGARAGQRGGRRGRGGRSPRG